MTGFKHVDPHAHIVHYTTRTTLSVGAFVSLLAHIGHFPELEAWLIFMTGSFGFWAKEIEEEIMRLVESEV